MNKIIKCIVATKLFSLMLLSMVCLIMLCSNHAIAKEHNVVSVVIDGLDCQDDRPSDHCVGYHEMEVKTEIQERLKFSLKKEVSCQKNECKVLEQLVQNEPRKISENVSLPSFLSLVRTVIKIE